MSRKKATLKEFKALAGLLNFVCVSLCQAGHSLGIIHGIVQEVCKSHHFIRVSVVVKEDLEVWLTFLDLFNGCCYFPQIG